MPFFSREIDALGEIFIERDLFGNTGQWYKIDSILAHEHSEFQEIVMAKLFINETDIRTALILDGILQIVDDPHHIAPYHESMLGVVLLHPDPKRVMIAGGGDGCALKTILTYKNIHATMVEIDKRVVELSQEHMPNLWHDPKDHRGSVCIQDAASYASNTPDETFDVLVVDSSDPNFDNKGTPANPLYSASFYSECKRALTREGLLIVQGGTFPVERSSTRQIVTKLQDLFETVVAMPVSVPSYSHGPMMLVVATNSKDALDVSEDVLRTRFTNLSEIPLWLNPAYLKALIKTPTNIQQELGLVA